MEISKELAKSYPENVRSEINNLTRPLRKALVELETGFVCLNVKLTYAEMQKIDRGFRKMSDAIKALNEQRRKSVGL